MSTGKLDLPHGQSYTNYLITEVKKEPIFSWLDLVPTNYWATFLFMDLHNYGGVPFTDQDPAGKDKTLTKYVEAHHKNLLRQQAGEDDEDNEDKENSHDDNEANIKKNRKGRKKRVARRKKKEINVRFEDDTDGVLESTAQNVEEGQEDGDGDAALQQVEDVMSEGEDNLKEANAAREDKEMTELLAQFKMRYGGFFLLVITCEIIIISNHFLA